MCRREKPPLHSSYRHIGSASPKSGEGTKEVLSRTHSPKTNIRSKIVLHKVSVIDLRHAEQCVQDVTCTSEWEGEGTQLINDSTCFAFKGKYQDSHHPIHDHKSLILTAAKTTFMRHARYGTGQP